MNYELIDHTADFGIRVFGADKARLFENTALAMVDNLTDTRLLKASRVVSISVSGQDWPDLMVNWLREILYLWTGEALLVKSVVVTAISEFSVSASVAVDPYDPDIHVMKNDIKAVTYHQIRVDAGPSGWEAAVIFDV